MDMNRIHDLNNGEAAVRIELRAPELFHSAADLFTLNRTVVREDHWDEAGIGSALHVVLAAQRMKPRAGPADMSCYQAEGDEAAGIVRAVNMLGDSHSPKDDRCLGCRENPGHVADCCCINSADFRHGLGREILDLFLKLIEAFGVRLDILKIIEIFIDYGVDDRIEKRDPARDPRRC